MNILLIFFALPLATILISIVLQKILRCPILVALIVFAIYLIVAFTAFDATFLIAAIIYTAIAFITAYLTMLICKLSSRIREMPDGNGCCAQNNGGCGCNTTSNQNSNGGCNLINNQSSSCGCNSQNSNEVITITTNMDGNGLVTTNNGNCINTQSVAANNTGCGCNGRNNNRVSARINIIPNSVDPNTGCLCGNYRRR